MRLTRLTLRNFRSFESLDLSLDDVTVIIGANNAGKSTILESIRCLLSDTDLAGAPWNAESLATTSGADGEEYLGPFTDQIVVVGTFEGQNGDVHRIGICFPSSRQPFGGMCLGPFFVYPSPEAAEQELPARVRGYGPQDEPNTLDIDGECWARLPPAIPFEDAGILTKVDVTMPHLITFAGPDAVPPTVDELLEPLFKAAIDRILESDPDIYGTVTGLIDSVIDELEPRLSEAARRWVPGVPGLVFSNPDMGYIVGADQPACRAAITGNLPAPRAWRNRSQRSGVNLPPTGSVDAAGHGGPSAERT